MAGEAAAAGHALYLCGHCHGGQVCLPGGRPVITHLSRHRELHTGLWRHGDMWGYTSTGAGLSVPPVRFNCRGEVTEFRLRTALTPLPPA
jgi:predicted MPP superfamily phosphohydrolase